MKRRRVLQAVAALPGAGFLTAQQPAAPPKAAPQASEETPKIDVTVADAAADTVPRYFSQSQFAALRRLCDIIAPRISETPGALDAQAPEFLDFLIGQSPSDAQQLYLQGLDRLNDEARKLFRAEFAQTTSTQADEILAPLRQPWTSDLPSEMLGRFLRQAKLDILDATVNSTAWVRVVSKRSRAASGLGSYWRTIE
jgi:hypothetical protein